MEATQNCCERKINKMTNVNDIIDYENGEMEFDRMVEFFQGMINDGTVWSLQGSYGRTANILIQDGWCVLKDAPREEY